MLLGIGMFMLGVYLVWVVCTLPVHPVSLAETVTHAMPQSGVKNPVTAVLLNFRGYDTLLEVAVLLLAVLGEWSLPVTSRQSPNSLKSVGGPIAATLMRLVVPLAVVIGGYLLWIGTDAPGGAFQAGAVLAGAWILLLLIAYPQAVILPECWSRLLLTVGFAVFLGVAGGMLLTGRALLEYPQGWTKAWLLLIESALTISIACILFSLFTGRPWPVSDKKQEASLSHATKEQE